MPFTFTTQIKKLDYLNMAVLWIPAEIVKQVGGTSNKRFLCSVNGAKAFQGGFQAFGDGEACINITAKRLKEAGVGIGDVAELVLTEDLSEYGMDMPEELREVLDQHPEGNRRFELLTPGRKRYIIHYVASVKNPQLRVDRALLLIGNLVKLPVGKEQFRQMLGLP
ncbi:MAG: YdeI/OmpD-associated family protein [Bacteroidota bacterium]